MVESTRKSIEPASLTPTERAAFYHGLRTYHQTQVWLKLSDSDCEPSKWGWKLAEDNHYVPVMTDLDPAPEFLMKIIRCSCKKGCGGRCSCRKAGLNCGPACKACHGLTCANVNTVCDSGDESE